MAAHFVIYQGHHGDIGAERADIVLPSAAYTEKNATYVNMEGRPQRAYAAVAPVGEAKKTGKSFVLYLRRWAKNCLMTHSINYVNISKLFLQFFTNIDEITPAKWINSPKKLQKLSITKEPFDEAVINFYMTDPISRVSKTMAECTRILTQEGSPQPANKEAA